MTRAVARNFSSLAERFPTDIESCSDGKRASWPRRGKRRSAGDTGSAPDSMPAIGGTYRQSEET